MILIISKDRNTLLNIDKIYIGFNTIYESLNKTDQFVFNTPKDIDRSKELKDIISGKGLKPLNESEDGLHEVKYI